MPKVDNFNLRNEELHMLSKYILKNPKWEAKIRKKPIFQEDGCPCRKVTLYSSKKYPELTKPWWCREVQHENQRKVFSASHWVLDVTRPSRGAHLHRCFWCPSHSSTTTHSKGHEDGYLLLECFLLLTFQCCFYLPNTGTKISISLDYIQFICKCQIGTN